MKTKLPLIVVLVTMTAISANAGWFSRDGVKKLDKVMGYTDKTEEVTADWDVCIRLWRESELKKRLGLKKIYSELSYQLVSSGGCNNVAGAYFSHALSMHECEPCAEDHISDYPKTDTNIKGVQYKSITKVYKDGKAMSVITEYAYPHKKITKTVGTKIKFDKSVTTVTEDTTHPNAK